MGDAMTLDEFIEKLEMIAAEGHGQAPVSMRDGSEPDLVPEWAVEDDFTATRTLNKVLIT